MSIVRSYTENNEIINEYPCDANKIVERDNDTPITEVDFYILEALKDTDGNMDKIDIEDDDGNSWCPV